MSIKASKINTRVRWELSWVQPGGRKSYARTHTSITHPGKNRWKLENNVFLIIVFCTQWNILGFRLVFDREVLVLALLLLFFFLLLLFSFWIKVEFCLIWALLRHEKAWSSHESHMKLTWSSHEVHMKLTWSSHEAHMKLTCTSHESHMNLTWISHESLMNLTWISHESHMNLTWISHESHMNLTWISHESHMNSRSGAECLFSLVLSDFEFLWSKIHHFRGKIVKNICPRLFFLKSFLDWIFSLLYFDWFLRKFSSFSHFFYLSLTKSEFIFCEILRRLCSECPWTIGHVLKQKGQNIKAGEEKKDVTH